MQKKKAVFFVYTGKQHKVMCDNRKYNPTIISDALLTREPL